MSEQDQINAEAISYVKESLSSGKTREEIYLEFLQQGWTLDDIQNIFEETEAESSKVNTHKKTISIILIVGAILVGAGIFSFIAANWQGASKVVKLLIIILAMLISHASGWYLMEKYSYKKTGEALILLGSIIFGAGLFLVAQIFNIRANWPDGFVLWMVGVLFLAYVINSYVQYALAIILSLTAFFFYTVIIFDDNFFSRLMISSVFLLLSAVILLVIGLKVRKRLPENLKNYY